MILGTDIHRAAVFLDGVAQTLQAVAVVARIVLCGGGKILTKVDLSLKIVLKADDEKIFLGIGGNMNEAFLLVRNLQLTFNGVVQGVSEDKEISISFIKSNMVPSTTQVRVMPCFWQ